MQKALCRADRQRSAALPACRHVPAPWHRQPALSIPACGTWHWVELNYLTQLVIVKIKWLKICKADFKKKKKQVFLFQSRSPVNLQLRLRVTQRFQPLQGVAFKSKHDKPQRFEVTGHLSRASNMKTKNMASSRANLCPLVPPGSRSAAASGGCQNVVLQALSAALGCVRSWACVAAPAPC